ncbi:18384_t:CDS:1, partial [Racocetra fulgida]
ISDVPLRTPLSTTGNNLTATSGKNDTIGNNSTATSGKNDTIGNNSTAASGKNDTIGNNSTAASGKNDIIGNNSTATSGKNDTIGNNSTATSSKNDTIGNNSTATSGKNDTIGNNSTATSGKNDTIGNNSTATSGKNDTIGNNSTATSGKNDTIGNNSTDISGKNDTTGNDTSYVDIFTPPVTILLTTPDPAKGLLFKIGSSITFSWKYSANFSIKPKYMNVLAQPSVNLDLYFTIVANATGTITSVIWDTTKDASSLPITKYKLYIFDERGKDASISPGRLLPFSGFIFSLYLPEDNINISRK